MAIKDGNAYPLLIDLMAAAGFHDGAECLRLLDEIEPHLGRGFHKSRSDVERARVAAADSDWLLVHAAAYAATCGLTWAMPATPSSSPPVPRETPFPRTEATCACGATIPIGAKFCAMCGMPTP